MCARATVDLYMYWRNHPQWPLAPRCATMSMALTVTK